MPEIGQSLSHYSIVEKIGKGGMGEVYRAKDQKLGRDVAIKVLPEEFARDADRIARFQREAKLLASLNHPNIAAIHGLEESSGTQFLVLELVDGETLADRIKRGPIPVEEALKLALQIAEALEAAHEKGVIHRDLKPANIKITPDGKVKVLDFGLAKAFAGEQADLNLSNSPTLSDMATQQGVILGTAAYMSPEQAKGKAADKKTDIWAFGCVLYEMLTGQAAFRGDDVSEILASVIKGDVKLDLLPANIHPRVREAITRCLQKEQKKRYPEIGDAHYEIEKALSDPSGVFVQPVTAIEPRKSLRTILLWSASLALMALIAGVAVWKLMPREPRRVMRFEYALPEGQQLISSSTRPILALSADGRQLVYSTPQGLFLRSVEQSVAKLIPGTEGFPQQPFFSPDGKWIGYWAGTELKLKKIAIDGGSPVSLCDAIDVRGAYWYPDNTIIYGNLHGGIMRISANGGTPASLAEMESEAATFPQILPDGQSLLHTLLTWVYIDRITVKSLRSGERKELFQGRAAWYLPTGHIVFRLPGNSSVFAIPFDSDKLETTGGPAPVVEGVGGLGAQLAVSEAGTMAYIPETGSTPAAGLILVWVDRHGKEQPLSAPPNAYAFPKISPDGTRVALTANIGGNPDVWIWDFARESLTRITFDEGEDNFPIWTPDGRWIVYRSSADGLHYDIKKKAADGSGQVEKIGSMPDLPGPFCWSRDGKALLSWDLTLSPYQTDITMMSVEGDHAIKPLLKEKYNEDHPRISPGGQWLAYASNESGRNEVYVRPFPEVNKGRWQISTGGGSGPLWSPDGRELFYRNAESVMAVPVETEPVFKAGKPMEIFRRSYYSASAGQAVLPMWDISSDGKRFLMMKEAGSAAAVAGGPRKINVVINWFEELKQLVPVK